MKEKLKNSLTISEKDKKLLVYVFAFLIIFIAYFVGYQNLSASLDTSTKQVTELTKKKKDLQNGVLAYRRQKTGQQLFIRWEKPMQEIIDKYDTSGTPYLLPIIRDMKEDARKQYKSEAHQENQSLKKIGKLLGLAIPLTSYVARHSWASIAKSKNIPIATISEAMGHDSENTTRIYLASLDTTVVDKANSLILKSL